MIEGSTAIEVVDYICKKFGVVLDWSKDNIMPEVMDLIQRYIKYSIVMNTIGTIVCLCIIFLSLFFPLRAYKEDKRFYLDASGWGFKDEWSLYFICVGIILFFSFVLFLIFSIHTIQWNYIPEIKILELMKG